MTPNRPTHRRNRPTPLDRGILIRTRYHRVVQNPKLKNRTLTNLYNERPAWLRLAHLTLDRAVLNAYAATDPAPHGQSGWTPAWAEVFEPTGAGQPLPEAHPLTQLRAETEQNILAALVKLNHQRSSPVADGGGGSASLTEGEL